MSNPDFEILADLKSHNAQRFERAATALLCDKALQRLVQAVLQPFGGSGEEARETFYYAVHKFIEKAVSGHFDPELGSIEAYIAGIARIHLYSVRRSQRREENRRQKAWEREKAEQAEVEQDELISLIYSRLAKEFPGNCGKIFTLLSVWHKAPEIMVELGYSSIETARVRISECRKKLWDHLDKHPEFKKICVQLGMR